MSSIPRRRKPKPMGCNSPPQIRNASHLKWIRGHECSVAYIGNTAYFCDGRVEAAHVRTGTDGGMSVKPSDCWTIPLCSAHHREQHNIGEVQFERDHGIDMYEIAEQLWKLSPHRHKSEIQP
jgi:hypothetical protein